MDRDLFVRRKVGIDRILHLLFLLDHLSFPNSTVPSMESMTSPFIHQCTHALKRYILPKNKVDDAEIMHRDSKCDAKTTQSKH